MSNFNDNFKRWVESHDPEVSWNWDDLGAVKKQFIQTVKESGDIDLATVYTVFKELEYFEKSVLPT